ADSFFQLSQISSNNYLNRNIAAAFINNYPLSNYKIILWETNQRGNWDIAFSIDSGDGWTAPGFLINSDEDELDPFFASSPYFFFYNNYFNIIYKKGNSIYLFKRDTIDSEQILFEGNDTVQYSNAAFSDDWNYNIVAAERRINGGDPYIVYRQKSYLDSIWSETKEAFPESPAINPRFIIADYNMALSFEIYFDGKRKFVWINLDDLGSSNAIHELLDDQSIETSDFFTLVFPVTKAKDYFDSYNPYSFRYVRNDSTFIRSAINYVLDTFYVDIYTKVGDSHSTLNVLGNWNYELISYTIWEDSSDGKVNLFGLKRINYLGDVKKELPPKTFSLSQNYPNPFNPNTKIQYAVGSRRNVSLKVYDILGREIITLVNEEKPAGEYEVEFAGSSLSSGIYFYQLKAGNSILTKKMVYLK
ncbi:MAG: T9SS type A sorting domain-containing protein, partial [Ignavibacteria bacterium]